MKKKLIATCLVIVLLAIAAVGSTLAYFTDTTNTATNTFTVGKVSITLDETNIADPQSTARVTSNTYELVPGTTYVKDPTVHVSSDSKDCYVRAFVTFSNADELVSYIDGTGSAAEKLLGLLSVNSNWGYSSYSTGKDTLTLELRYNNVAKAADDLVIFSQFTAPSGVINNSLENFTVTVYAEAIQADGFTNAEAAFTALTNANSNSHAGSSETSAPGTSTPETT
jgi:predicted ribosomally synthesized peptide with SipW-like signal peptide